MEDTSSNLASLLTPTTLNTGLGNDRVFVKRVTEQLIVNGQSGRDSIEFGLNGSTGLLNNDVTITNTGGFTALTINAQADVANRTVDFITLVDGRAVLQGLAVTRFFYPRGDVSDLTINTGNGKDAFIVRDTIARGIVTLNSGGGDDLVFVNTVSSTRLTVNSGAGNDKIFVGGSNSTLDTIFGAFDREWWGRRRHPDPGGSREQDAPHLHADRNRRDPRRRHCRLLLRNRVAQPAEGRHHEPRATSDRPDPEAAGHGGV